MNDHHEGLLSRADHATITATGQEKFQVGFAPLLAGFKYAPFNDLPALEGAISEDTCGILLEPIQGKAALESLTNIISKGSGKSAIDTGY